MYTAKERIEYILNEKHIRAADICHATGINNPVLSDIRRGRVSTISSKVATAIHNAFPEFTLSRLLTGKGSPMEENVHPAVMKLRKILEAKQKQLDLIQKIIDREE